LGGRRPVWWDGEALRREREVLDRFLDQRTRERRFREDVQRTINLTDAESECEHGAVAGDRVKPAGCECWPLKPVEAQARRGMAGPNWRGWDPGEVA
jgi:hypothetical protein